MNNQILNDNTAVFYMIMSENEAISPQKFDSQFAAEQAKLQLPQPVQESASIVPVTSGGQQVLLG